MRNKLIIESDIISDINQYCELNDISDVSKFCEELLKDNFLRIKWGEKDNVEVSKPEKEKKEEIKTDNKNRDFYGEQ